MNEVLKAIAERSSTRKYKDQPVEQEKLMALLTAGLQGPTANNMQEVHISVLSGDDKYLNELSDEIAKANGRENFCLHYKAPVVMMLSAKEGAVFGPCDAGIAVQNIALAAQALGLGSVILGMPWRIMASEKKDYYGKAFGFPEGYKFEIGIAVGYKDTEKTPHDIDLEGHVSFIK